MRLKWYMEKDGQKMITRYNFSCNLTNVKIIFLIFVERILLKKFVQYCICSRIN